MSEGDVGAIRDLQGGDMAEEDGPSRGRRASEQHTPPQLGGHGDAGVDIWSSYLPSEKAAQINRDRMETYGDPRPNYTVFAQLLEALFGHPVTPQEAVMVMMMVKVMREICGGFPSGYNDNLEDICGFANVLHVVKEANSGVKHVAGRTGRVDRG